MLQKTSVFLSIKDFIEHDQLQKESNKLKNIATFNMDSKT